jgi:hypothetical protein
MNVRTVRGYWTSYTRFFNLENCALLGYHNVSEPTGCPETSANYHHWLRDNPEDRSSHLLRGVSLKSGIFSLDEQRFTKDVFPVCKYTPEGITQNNMYKFSGTKYR